MLQFTYPDGNCNVFKFQPKLCRASDKRRMSKSLDPIAITDVAGVPNIKIPFILRM